MTLSKEAESLITQARAFESPVVDRDQIKMRVLASVGVLTTSAATASAAASTGVAQSAVSGSVAASAGTALSTGAQAAGLAVKMSVPWIANNAVWLAGALLVAGTGTAYVMSRSQVSERSVSSAAAPISIATPTAAPTDLLAQPHEAQPESPSVELDAAEPAARTEPLRSSESQRAVERRARPRPQTALPLELASLEEIEAALSSGRALEAQRLLRVHRQSFPSGLLAEECDAMAAIATCMSNADGPGNLAVLGRFSEVHARSPLRRRVERACTSN